MKSKITTPCMMKPALSGKSSNGLSLTVESASWTQNNIFKRLGSTYEAQHCLRANLRANVWINQLKN